MNTSLFTKTPGCVATAAQIVGDKWTPMLIRALAEQDQRFNALQDKAGGINPRTLSARLVKLENAGIVTRISHDEQPSYTSYSLTKKGRDLIPILEQMARWGDKYGRTDC